MDFEASERDLLESMLLDTTKKPIPLPLSLLKSITNNFCYGQEISKGGFSVVYKGRLRNGIVAVKRLLPELDMDDKTFKNEIICLIRLKHKNIVRFLGYCADTQGKVEVYQEHTVIADIRQRLLCFEFLQNGGLDKHMNDESCEIEWGTCYQIIKGICVGLHYLHQQNIVHGDLKPANILLDDDMVPKIADFGRSRCFDENQTHAITKNLVGTWGYMAPEFIISKVITLKSDIYSLGIIIIEVLTGQKGYLHLQIENILKSWRTRFRMSLGSTWTEYARVCAEIGLKCMDFDYLKRPDMQHIIESLDKLERRTLMEMDTARSSDRLGQTSKEIVKQEYIISQVPSHPAEEMAHNMAKSILGSMISKAAAKVFLIKESMKGQRYFDQHAGRMLSRILETDGNNTFKLYDRGDLVKATRGFHKANIIGEGAHGTVYKAILGTATVAVKRCKQIDKSRTSEFVQELVVLCRVSHRNIVRLLGCCLHFKAPMLVYEFVPNGTLSDLLHGRPRSRVTLPTRLRIAAETAEALAHLHSPPYPILHGDIMSQNIMLGEGWVAKVSDFGCSTINDNVQVVPKGTLAYLDPEFLQDFQITEKTDVYSFGVVLIELLTGKNPQTKESMNLTVMFQDSMGNDTLGELLEPDIVEEGSKGGLIYAAAQLVSRCIAFPGKARPAMAEVAVELRRFSDEIPESAEAQMSLEVEVDRHSCTASTEGGTTGS